MNDGAGNGLFLKIVLGVCVSGLVASGGIIFRLSSDVAALVASQQADRRIDDLRAQMIQVREVVESINSDRHQRTQILRDFERRLEALERQRP